MRLAARRDVGSSRRYDCVVRAVVVVVLLGLAVAVPASAGLALAPPVIHEIFTPLPCPKNPTTTLALEGCAEKTILATDHAINVRVKVIFGLLKPEKRIPFVKGEKAYLRYRSSQCKGDSMYATGTERSVQFAYCVIAENREHLKALAAVRSVLPRH